MKKFIFLLSALLLCILPLTVNAEKTTFKKPTYNFTGLQNIYVTDVVKAGTTSPNEDNFATQKIAGYIGQFLQEKKIPHTVNKDNYFIYPSKFSTEKKYTLDVDINSYGFNYLTKPGYWESYTYYREVRRRDKRGNWYTEQVPEERTRYIPPTTVRICFVDVTFDLKDLATNQTVYNLRDSRDRETDTPDDMAKRVVKDFLSDLKKMHDGGK